MRAAVGGALASPAAAFALEAEKCRIVLRGVGVAGSEGNSNALGGMGWGGVEGFWICDIGVRRGATACGAVVRRGRFRGGIGVCMRRCCVGVA